MKRLRRNVYRLEATEKTRETDGVKSMKIACLEENEAHARTRRPCEDQVYHRLEFH
jgi:hypothetical protein